MKICPHCKSEVSDTAKKCKHCWEWVDKEKLTRSYTIDNSNETNQENANIKTPQKTESKNKHVIVITIIVIILWCLMYVWYSFISYVLLTKKSIYDALEQANIEEIWDTLSLYYNKFGSLPWLGIENMVPISTYSQEIEDKLWVSIPTKSEDTKSYLWITNKLILSWEYWYYPSQEWNIISFVIMAKTDTEFWSNYIYDSSISNDKPKVCNTVSKWEIFWRDLNDNCIYTDEEQLRYIYVGEYVKEEKKEESNTKSSNKKTNKGSTNKTQTKQQPVQYQPDEYEAWKQRTEEYKNTHPNETSSPRYDEATATPEEKKAHEEYYAPQNAPLPITL